MMFNKRSGVIGITLMLLALSLNGFSQNVTAAAKLDKADILLGDQTVLRLTVNLPANGKVEFPSLSDTISAKVQIVAIGKLDTLKQDNGRWLISRAYTITSFDSGIQVIPSFKFRVSNEEISTDPLPLQVEEVKVDTTKGMYDIKQPMAVKYTFVDWLRDNWGFIISGILLFILLIGIWFYYKKRRPVKAIVVEQRPTVEPDVEALQKIEVLRAKKLWQQEEVKAYYSELTDIIREYLEKRFKISAFEQTSEEILASLMHLDITDQNKERLKNILVRADLVKFAKQNPSSSDNEVSIDNAVVFVQESKPALQPQIKVQGENEFN